MAIPRGAAKRQPPGRGTKRLKSATMHEPKFAALLEQISQARAQGKSMDQMMQMAADFLAAQPADYAGGKRDELLAQVRFMAGQGGLLETIFNVAKSGDEKGGIKGLLSLYANVHAAEPPEDRGARRKKGLAALAAAQAEADKHAAAHKKQRRAKGLSGQAGTGRAQPEVLLHGLPI